MKTTNVPAAKKINEAAIEQAQKIIAKEYLLRYILHLKKSESSKTSRNATTK